jgi:DNA primase
MQWEEVALSLPEGTSKKVHHCGKGKSMVLYNTNKGVSRHCFRCSDREFIPHGQRSISALRKSQAAMSYVHSKEVTLPDDFTFDIPKSARTWLLLAGVSTYLSEKYGIGWSPSMGRVILPTRRGGELVYVQCRDTSPRPTFKYLNNPPNHVGSIITWSDPDTLLWGPVLGEDTVVLVEDYLSAIRVGRITHAASILGTTITDSRLSQIVSRFSKVVLWFDNDPAGQSCASKHTKQLSLMGIPSVTITTELDPKMYNNTEIDNILEGVNQCLKDK